MVLCPPGMRNNMEAGLHGFIEYSPNNSYFLSLGKDPNEELRGKFYVPGSLARVFSPLHGSF